MLHVSGWKGIPRVRNAASQSRRMRNPTPVHTIIGDSSHFSFCFTTRVFLLRIHRRFIARMLVSLALLSMGNFLPSKGDVGQGIEELLSNRENTSNRKRTSDREGTALSLVKSPAKSKQLLQQLQRHCNSCNGTSHPQTVCSMRDACNWSPDCATIDGW